MKEYKFIVTFYDCPDTFCVDAESLDEAKNKVIEEIQNAIQFDVDCVEEPDEDEDEDD